MYIYQKPKSLVVWEGRPDFSFLFKSCEILEVRGDLSINVENKKSSRVYMYIYQKPKSLVVWEGRLDFSFLFKSCEILEVRGDLSINVENMKSSRVDR